ncbi:MAG TPA: acylphosphatase [Phototrophicaceae bacterium]|nr:acylphosphatase [Phototrophicaceae bacterium]
MAEAHQRVHAVVHGRVQGVNFRYYTMQTANELELTGWVRNLIEGTVEVVAEGSRIRLERLLRFLYSGPSNARVSEVEIEWGDPTGEFEGFRIR